VVDVIRVTGSFIRQELQLSTTHMGVTSQLTYPDVIARPYEYVGRIREMEPIYRNDKWGG
jgi:hypothetical protein